MSSPLRQSLVKKVSFHGCHRKWDGLACIFTRHYHPHYVQLRFRRGLCMYGVCWYVLLEYLVALDQQDFRLKIVARLIYRVRYVKRSIGIASWPRIKRISY